MKNKKIYDKKILEYDNIIKSYEFFIISIPTLEEKDKRVKIKNKEKLATIIKREQEIFIEQKKKFINLFNPLLQNDEEFIKNLKKFNNLEQQLYIEYTKETRERIKIIKNLKRKILLFEKISNILQKSLKFSLLLILINTFINFIILPNTVVKFLGLITISFLGIYIFSLNLYKDNINKAIVFLTKNTL